MIVIIVTNISFITIIVVKTKSLITWDNVKYQMIL